MRRRDFIRWIAWHFAVGCLSLMSLPGSVWGQAPALVAPPRTVTDITAILDQEKPDPVKAAAVRAQADAGPPAVKERRALARFYFQRAEARSLIGRVQEAIADCEKAIEFDSGSPDVNRYEAFLSNQYSSLGQFSRAVEINHALVRKYVQGDQKGAAFSSYSRIVNAYLASGDIENAQRTVAQSQKLLEEARAWPGYSAHNSDWQAFVDEGRSRVLFERGRYKDAELVLRNTQALKRDALAKSVSWPVKPFRGVYENTIDRMIVQEGQSKVRQGRVIEGEADIRKALLSRLKLVGKYHASTAGTTIALSEALNEQTRFAEAEQLARRAVEIYRALGSVEDDRGLVRAKNMQATTLNRLGRFDESAKLYEEIDDATRNWKAVQREQLRASSPRVFANYLAGNISAGIELARAALSRERARYADGHFNVALARATLGAGLVLAGRDADALQEYSAALPVLLASTHESDDDDTQSSVTEQRLQRVIESYLTLLARNRVTDDVAAESFRLTEIIRGHAVERSLLAASTRAVLNDTGLATLVRREQDLQKEIGARLGALTNMLALPPEERDEKAIAAHRDAIAKLRSERIAARRNIERRVPGYGDLVSPRAATIEQVRAVLRPNEAFVSIYVGATVTFMWAVPRSGPIAFASVSLGSAEVTRDVERLREAFDAEVATVSDIPPFDVRLAHQLYAQLLEPIASGWRSAQSLIVVSNGTLARLPLALLPTAQVELPGKAEPAFTEYRDVPWLVRTHSVTVVPSAAALRSLRQLPQGKPSREAFIGFGDPLFDAEQAVEFARTTDPPVQVAELTGRGFPLARRASARFDDRSAVTLLPRLPDTAEELRAIAQALGVDPSKALHLGKDANEQKIKTSDLSRYKIVAFATHGLIPGDLDGLTQPALALTAPRVAGVGGDGLLTMEEILALKLDADWVLLSACNTAAASGAGAETATGLARAFFYAGTRAVLVTNWAVHSDAARSLVSELFRRQGLDSKLSRGEALRQAMLALIDGMGYTNSTGNTLFSYAHPLFWAPYTIIGDGGV